MRGKAPAHVNVEGFQERRSTSLWSGPWNIEETSAQQRLNDRGLLHMCTSHRSTRLFTKRALSVAAHKVNQTLSARYVMWGKGSRPRSSRPPLAAPQPAKQHGHQHIPRSPPGRQQHTDTTAPGSQPATLSLPQRLSPPPPSCIQHQGIPDLYHDTASHRARPTMVQI